MSCLVCGVAIAVDDNYCRKCGAPLHVIDVPVVRSESRALTAWEGAKPAMARGMALLAAGALLRYVAGRAGKAVLGRALAPSDGGLDPGRIISLAGARSPLHHGTEETEILWYRRVRR